VLIFEQGDINMTGTRIYDKGAIAEASREGTQIDAHVSSSGFAPFKVQTAWTHNTSSALSADGGFAARPGVQTISGTVAHTVVFPAASDNVGAMFMFRLTSADAHVLTASNEAGGSRAIVAKDGVVSGSLFTFLGTVGAAAGFWCDGVRYHLVAGSGSITGA
jgi:hypothetical protein